MQNLFLAKPRKLPSLWRLSVKMKYTLKIFDVCFYFANSFILIAQYDPELEMCGHTQSWVSLF